METPKTLLEAVTYFSDRENCRKFMIALRWQDGIVRCPACGSDRVTFLAKANVYKCKTVHPKQKFSLKTGTVFEDSPIGLEKWLPASWMLSNCKNGISSYELHRALGVTQKTAWFMLHRIRIAMTDRAGKVGGSGSPVECDETFIGGNVQKMHKSQRVKANAKGGNKTIVLGMLERGGRVKAQVIKSRSKAHMDEAMTANVEAGSNLMTDEFPTYKFLETPYNREVTLWSTSPVTFTRKGLKTSGHFSSVDCAEPISALNHSTLTPTFQSKFSATTTVKTPTIPRASLHASWVSKASV
jgi:transposase-like protein